MIYSDHFSLYGNMFTDFSFITDNTTAGAALTNNSFTWCNPCQYVYIDLIKARLGLRSCCDGPHPGNSSSLFKVCMTLFPPLHLKQFQFPRENWFHSKVLNKAVHTFAWFCYNIMISTLTSINEWKMYNEQRANRFFFKHRLF